MHIQISLGTKFQVKFLISCSDCLDQISRQKRIFGQKRE